MNLKRIARRLWRSSPQDWLAALAGEKRANVDSRQREVGRYAWCLSTGRVGTKTLAALGALNGEVDARHEPSPSLYGLGRVAYDRRGEEAAGEVIREALSACRPPVRAEQFNVSLETSPQVTFLAEQLRDLFPGSRFVHVIRHPGAVLRSGMRRRWYDGHSHDRWRLVPTEGSAAATDWDRWSRCEKNAWLWAETNRWILEFLEKLSPEEYVTIRSEDLFEGQEEAVNAFFGCLGVSPPPAPVVAKVLGRKLNRQTAGSFPEWGDWSREQREEVLPHVEGLLQQFYPSDGLPT